MNINVNVHMDENDSISIEEHTRADGFKFKTLTIGNCSIFVNNQSLSNLSEAIEHYLLPEDEHRGTLKNKIEGLEEQIADLQNELEDNANESI